MAAELNLANDFEATQKANQVDKVVQSKESQNKCPFTGVLKPPSFFIELTDEVKTLQDTNRALQLYMNKILMKIIDNKQLEDVLSIDQPKPKPMPIIISDKKDASQVEPSPRSAGLGPPPTRTLSSTLLSKATASRQQRRRTISYWGSKAPSSVPAEADQSLPPLPETLSPTPTATTSSLADRANRRHSAMPSKDSNNNNGGGWAKALRRMSIGWSASSPNDSNGPDDHPDKAPSPPSDDSLDPSSTYINRPPSMSRSASSTTSLRASNELANIQEE